MVKPAIVAVGYNRPEGIKRLLKSIGRAKFKANDIPLIVSIDESDKSDEVEKIAREFKWEHGTFEVRRFPKRQGLRSHIIQCGDYSEKYGGVIILEDDLIVAEDFYSYVCWAHETFGEDERICGVALYSYSANVFNHFRFTPAPSMSDVYLGDMVVTWGQSWTLRQWRNFKNWFLEHENKLPAVNTKIPRDISGWKRSWGIYFASFMADKRLSYIYPYLARTTCYSDFGEHNTTSIPLTFVQVPLMSGCPNKYSTLEYTHLVHYDAFFERVLDDNDTISGIKGTDICMDLNNMKMTSGEKEYIISNSILPFERIASYGMTLKPISLNVINEIKGNQLHLYRVDNGANTIRSWKGKNAWYQYDYMRFRYEYYDASWRYLLRYAPQELINRTKELLISLRKKIVKRR